MAANSVISTPGKEEDIIHTFFEKLFKKHRDLCANITKEGRILEGCERLLKALNRKKHISEVQQAQLCRVFAAAKAEVLRNELRSLNDSFSRKLTKSVVGEDCITSMFKGQTPMVVFPIKEGIASNFHGAINNVLQRHYFEFAAKFSDEINLLQEERDVAIRPQTASVPMVKALLNYYDDLIDADSRFFCNKTKEIVFSWYDALSGKEMTSTDANLEKGSVLYNVAAIISVLASFENKNSENGLESAITFYELGAGVAQLIIEHYTTTDSDDLNRPFLTAMLNVFLAQAQECIFLASSRNSIECMIDPGELAAVAVQYGVAASCLKVIDQSLIPPSWPVIIGIKQLLYEGLSFIHEYRVDISSPHQSDNPHQIKMTRIKNASALMRVLTTFDALSSLYERNKDDFPELLYFKEEIDKAHQIAENFHKKETMLFEQTQSEVHTIVHLLPVKAAAARYAKADMSLFDRLFDDPSTHRGLFHRLGPVSFFNGLSTFERPRICTIRSKECNLGFSIVGSAPVKIVDVVYGTLGYRAGLRDDQSILAINDVDVRWGSTQDVLSLLVLPVDVLQIVVTSREPISIENDTLLIPDMDWMDESSVATRSEVGESVVSFVVTRQKSGPPQLSQSDKEELFTKMCESFTTALSKESNQASRRDRAYTATARRDTLVKSLASRRRLHSHSRPKTDYMHETKHNGVKSVYTDSEHDILEQVQEAVVSPLQESNLLCISRSHVDNALNRKCSISKHNVDFDKHTISVISEVDSVNEED